MQALVRSESAKDALKMLDSFYDSRKSAAKAAETAARNKQRLDAAITPRGSGEASVNRNISDREKMMQGFASVDT